LDSIKNPARSAGTTTGRLFLNIDKACGIDAGSHRGRRKQKIQNLPILNDKLNVRECGKIPRKTVDG